MVRRLIPLIAVVPLGVAFGLLASAQEWTDTTRILAMAGVTVVLVAIGTPVAMLRLRRLPDPAPGLANLAAFELGGVYSEYPVSPRKFPRELSALRSDPTVLVPVIRPALTALDPSMERVILVSDPNRRTYQGRLRDVTYDVTLWPDRRRRRPLRRSFDRTVNRAVDLLSTRSISDVPDRTVDRVIDQASA
jgi:hypothetical protein